MNAADGDDAPVAEDEDEAFDFDEHRQKALDLYAIELPTYASYASTIAAILTSSLTDHGLVFNSVESRAKSLESFGRKASQPDDTYPDRPKYADPMAEITDLAAARVITFFVEDVERVDEVVHREFEVLERSDKRKLLEESEKLGYQSVHYLVRLESKRGQLPEYVPFAGLIGEVQVRTILQHAWAEIEHDIQYKAIKALPTSIRRRFMALAGVLEIADREFQAIDAANRRSTDEARESVSRDDVSTVEITPDALKTYLDRRLGADGRMSSWSYTWATRLLIKLGFTTLGQVGAALDQVNVDRVSRALHGTRQGQLYRMEEALLCVMGERFVERHLWSDEDWFVSSARTRLSRLKAEGIRVGSWIPEDSGDGNNVEFDENRGRS